MSKERSVKAQNHERGGDFVTVRLGDQLLGIPVQAVHDVLKLLAITKVPLAPGRVAGVMNLRGRIVTAIDLRARLGLPPRPADAKQPMCVVVEQAGQPYALVIDSVGDVISVPVDRFEQNPATLSPHWRQVSAGVYRLEKELLVVADVASLLADDYAAAA